jgi:hypothetical protein
MKIYKCVLTCIILAASLGLSAGRYAGDFMLIGAGVRPLGMGGAFAAVADDGNAIYWNSSGIAQIRQSDITIMHAFLYNGIASYDNISFCQPLPNEVTIGLNLTRLTIDEIPRFDEFPYLIGHTVDERINNSHYQLTGNPDGYFRSTDDLFQFAFSKHIHYDLNMGWLFFAVPVDTYIGANIKYIKRQVNEVIGTGTGFDLSFLARTDLSTLFDVEGMGNIAFGINFQDIANTEITWGEADNFHKDSILFNSKVGLAVDQPIEKLKSKLTLAYDVDYIYKVVHHFGLDWNYDSKANLRLGYYDRNYSAGASVKVYGIYIDYAAITNTLGLTNRLGLRINF